MSDFTSYLKQQLDNPEFRAEYEALEPEFSPIQARIDARKDTTMTPMDEEQWKKAGSLTCTGSKRGKVECQHTDCTNPNCISHKRMIKEPMR